MALNLDLDLPAALRQPSLWARLAVLAAGAVLAIALARLLWLLLSGPALPLDVAPALPAPALHASAQAPPAPIAQWHLFGDAMPMQPSQAIDAPETALQLFLRGTVNDAGDGGGYAIISDAEGGEQSYRVGDALPGGATLTAVYAGRVLLQRDGLTEQLSLPVDATPGAAATAGSTRTAAGRSGRNAAALPGASSALPFINPVISTGGPRIDPAVRAALPNVDELVRQVNMLPVVENDRMVGVRLSAGRGSDLLTRTGIRPTDIITSVNGIPLDGAQRQQQLLESLQRGGSAQLTLRRDGKDVQLSVDLP